MLDAQIVRVGFFGRSIPAAAHGFSVPHYLHVPAPVGHGDAAIARRAIAVRLMDVLKIYVSANVAKIVETIILSAPVNMVNVLRRPITCDVEPRQSVRKILRPIYGDHVIPRGVGGTSSSAYQIGTPRVAKPRKMAGVCVVNQELPKPFGCEHCHDNVFTIGVA